ncbi:hypothetical protein R3P38DRAFT_3229208 [Favolaschia claudopus]|uniref:Zn(2)-C6 fungal-type domain-containing protein n=1 Tax=Favolaschia claudopus TaxID=2862362 RepID=A0AAV9ZQ39_9AGAR
MSCPSHPSIATYTFPFSHCDQEECDGHDFDPDSTKKSVRRRSSKACDQCRKSKCKCERSGLGNPCRSCVALGTECTSRDPSRKRGPPKGYVHAIEARLHQTEALVGILLAAAGVSYVSDSSLRVDGGYTRKAKYTIGEEAKRGDNSYEREVNLNAQTVLTDLAEDPLARAILTRIDVSAYGPAGRILHNSKTNSKTGANNDERGSLSPSAAAAPGNTKTASDRMDSGAGSGRPSHEWMDRVTAHILRRARERRNQTGDKNQAQFHCPPQLQPQPSLLHPTQYTSPHILEHSQSHPHVQSTASDAILAVVPAFQPQPLQPQTLRTHHSAHQLRAPQRPSSPPLEAPYGLSASSVYSPPGPDGRTGKFRTGSSRYDLLRQFDSGETRFGHRSTQQHQPYWNQHAPFSPYSEPQWHADPQTY